MSRYLIGNGNDQWQFSAAFNACKDGDVLEFAEGLNLSLGTSVLIIDKNISIEGTPNTNNEITNKIMGFVKVLNGVNVNISNIFFEASDKGNNVFAVKGNSTAKLSNVIIEQTDNLKIGSNEQFYPEVYVGGFSKLILERAFMPEKNGLLTRILVEAGCLEVRNSVLNTLVQAYQSEITAFSSTIKRFNGNAVHLVKSFATLQNTFIQGGDNEKEFPAMYIDRSNVLCIDTNVSQSQFHACVGLVNNSYLSLKNGNISSIHCDLSTVDMSNTNIIECITGQNNSKLVSNDNINIMGESKTRVDIFLNDYSIFRAAHVNLNRIIEPNIRVSNNSLLLIDELTYNQTWDYEKINQIQMECKDGGRIEVESLQQQEKVESNDFGDQSDDNFDKDFEVEVSDDPQAELDKLIGLHSVKEEINKMVRMVEFNKKRVEQGLKPEENSLHSVFLGNPGTGKTTVARLIGEILFKNGALHNKEKFIFVESCESDLISSYVGKTAEQTYELLEKAKGGILFIDEAYTLNKGDSSVNFGQEAINTILKYMEDHRNEIMIIFAGYTKEMEQFLETNPGLKSRVANKFVFEDYTGDEIVQIGENILKDKQYVLEDEEHYKKSVKDAYEMSIDKSNARWIRNFNEKLLKVFAKRVLEENSDDMATIRNSDIDEVFNIGKYQNHEGKDEDAYEKLDKLIGIEQVKSQVAEFISIAELNKKRCDQGQANQTFSLHSLFLGNPGTGKTTVARILGDILYQKSIIKDNKFIEVSRSDLVAGYVGQTAIKTREVLKSALGGVLFIDEAYSLCQNGSNDFGNEAIDEILKFMEDNRDNIVIILAGYNREMAEFLKMNSGLESRIPNKFTFEDYSIDEIVKIGLMYLEKFGYVVDKDLYRDVVAENYAMSNDNSNGRWIRNLNEKLIRIMSQRVAQTNTDDLNTIATEDLMKMRNR